MFDPHFFDDVTAGLKDKKTDPEALRIINIQICLIKPLETGYMSYYFLGHFCRKQELCITRGIRR